MNHASDRGLLKGNDQATKDHFSQSNILILITKYFLQVTRKYNHCV